ncbi:hypothetical protein GCM10009849_27160 [Sinomonas flava]|uniref:Uncharacterized protein n=1 Tax=Sinomonas flava TaxID=496857 RepID=A0ABN3BXM2_9MICC
MESVTPQRSARIAMTTGWRTSGDPLAIHPMPMDPTNIISEPTNPWQIATYALRFSAVAAGHRACFDAKGLPAGREGELLVVMALWFPPLMVRHPLGRKAADTNSQVLRQGEF